MNVSLQGVEKTFLSGRIPVTALKDINCNFAKGSTVFIRGKSGSGKTTLLTIIGLLETPAKGSVLFDGEPVPYHDPRRLAILRRERLAFIYQNFNLLPELNALENILLPFVPTGTAGKKRSEALAMLKRLGLNGMGHRLPDQLSGGEKQRVAIARAALKHPSIILADEPTGELDSGTAEIVMELLRSLSREEGASLIIATHDLSLQVEGEKILCMKDGSLVDGF